MTRLILAGSDILCLLMRLHEYQSKLLFSRYGIPVPKGRIASTASEVKQIAQQFGGRVVVKSQVLVSGRGKAGGIRLVKSADEAQELAVHLLGMEIKGMPVHKVLVEEAINIGKEIYLAIINDRVEGKPQILASAEGGMNIEEISQQSPEKITRIHIDPLFGLMDFQIKEIAASIDLPRQHWRSFIGIAQGLWSVYNECDATLAEINPFVITADQQFVALDAKIILDDNAIYRHLDLAEMRDSDAEDRLETRARKYGLVYLKLDGQIGCMVNGAGLAMATMDLIKLSGGKPANFLDIGGGATAEKVTVALRIVLSDKNVRSILINIFGGITRCDEVAKGIRIILEEEKPAVPLVVRLVGTNAAEGLNLLEGTGVLTAETLYEAAQIAIEAVKGIAA